MQEAQMSRFAFVSADHLLSVLKSLERKFKNLQRWIDQLMIGRTIYIETASHSTKENLHDCLFLDFFSHFLLSMLLTPKNHPTKLFDQQCIFQMLCSFLFFLLQKVFYWLGPTSKAWLCTSRALVAHLTRGRRFRIQISALITWPTDRIICISTGPAGAWSSLSSSAFSLSSQSTFRACCLATSTLGIHVR